jgi:methionyl-tRNA synthetase
MTDKRQILATCALLYANGPLHLGHLVEHIQADIWMRFQRLRGHEALFVCGSDCHGTPVMLRAQKEGITPEELVTRIAKEHINDLETFLVSYDHFDSTHSNENKTLVEAFYLALKENGDITSREIEQAYDAEKEMFLPDRFVKGDCPKCNAKDQYGDSCESCGATYSPTDLKNPISALSGTTPTQKKSQHFFFKLGNYETFLKKWINDGHLQNQVTNKLGEWFDAGLKDWDISRDAPYFGFEIPGEKDKYFYVWLDAPIGYMASFKALCDKKNIDFNHYWKKDSTTELYHFIGKDIIYFHALFWPAMLEGAGYRKPSAIKVHSFLTVGGKKMSKSRGTFIKAATYAKHLNPEYLRYYYAAKLSSHIEDIDLNFEDFQLRINSDLIGKFVNIASRCAGFITKRFDGKLVATLENEALYQELSAQADDIAKDYENLDTSQAVRKIMALADKANQYIAEKEPWKLVKVEGKENDAWQVCSLALNLFKILAAMLKPILPETIAKSESFLNVDLDWQSIQTPLLDHSINKFKPLLTRIEEEQVTALQEEAKQDVQ